MEKTPVNLTWEDYVEDIHACLQLNRPKEEITEIYEGWENYEEHTVGKMPNRPKIGAAAFLAQYGDKEKDIRILDVGAGTGLAAAELVKLGFTNIDALEPCESLAKKALEKNIYKKWYKAYVCKDRLPINDDVYDVVYSVGVFGPAHAREDSFEELIRILKPGGQIMTVMAARYFTYPCMANFEPRILELEKEGILIYKEKRTVQDYLTDPKTQRDGAILILEKPITNQTSCQ